MTWFRVDDQFTRHEKYHLAGKDGRQLWFAVGVECAAASTDGRVPGHMLRAWAAAAEVPVRLSAKLVKAGLWHDASSLCPRCVAACEEHGIELAPGDFFFHDWDTYQLDKAGKNDPVHRERELRRKRLHRNPQLKAQVRNRDRDLCRYCGKLTVWGSDHKSPMSGTFDHIDPFGENTLTNLVVACRLDNGRKKDRTPEQAGMTLLPAPSYDPDSGLDIQPPIRIGDRSADRVGLRDGTGRVGPGPDLDSGLDRVGSVNGNGSLNGNGDH